LEEYVLEILCRAGITPDVPESLSWYLLGPTELNRIFGLDGFKESVVRKETILTFMETSVKIATEQDWIRCGRTDVQVMRTINQFKSKLEKEAKRTPSSRKVRCCFVM
jgi:hypothetical protein